MIARRLRWPLVLVVLCACNTRLCRDPAVERKLAQEEARKRAEEARNWKPPEYTAVRTATPPVIDGKLDDAVWEQAPWTAYLHRSSGPDRPGTQHTRAKLAWDDTALYVAFEVEDDDIITRDEQTKQPYVKDDDPLYQSEVVEVFVDADANGATYNEIEVSPLNKLFDASFVAYRKMDLSWQSGVQHAVQVDGSVNDESDKDRGWTAELAIPFGPLLALPHRPPQVGERWRFNLYRLDHGRGGEEGQAFSPVSRPDFHDLSRFGTLILGGPASR